VTTISAPSGVGDLLRGWRQRRRLSQLDLSVEAEVSARHLSFVETGRSRPSRELVLHLAEHLEVPLRERNSLLLAAGYSPAYTERSLEDGEMDPVREVLDRILNGHEPYPAVIVDRGWDLVSANTSALTLFTEGVAAPLLEPPINVYRLGLHPDGLAPRVRNFAEYSQHLITQLRRDAALSGDARLAELLDQIRGYPGVVDGPAELTHAASLLFLPIELEQSDGTVLSLFSTISTFGTALDVTLAELSIEQFFPADDATREALSIA
jgi:transcriptional regulator with XRE-family HTH domain